jgi:5-hydroxyisourate hydrolase-like protein (transthyretin family)
MNKAILGILAILACFLPLSTVTGDNNTPGDDLIETTFYGIVTNSETGAPIEGAYVYSFDSDYSHYQGDITDEEGNYYLEFNLGGDFYIYAEMQDYKSGQELQSVDVNDKTEVDFELDPILYTSKIYGTVTDSVSGEPLDGVAINVYSVDDRGYMYNVKNSGTGSNGMYAIDIEDGTYAIEFFKNGYSAVIKEDIVVEGEDLKLDIAMVKFTQGVTGVVTNENGNPMEGIGVSLQSNMGRYYDQTDEDGNYEIFVSEPGFYTLEAYASGHRPFSQDITIDEGEVQDIDIELQKAYLPDPIVRLIYRILSILGIM